MLQQVPAGGEKVEISLSEQKIKFKPQNFLVLIYRIHNDFYSLNEKSITQKYIEFLN